MRKPKLYKGEGRVQSCAAAGVTLWVVEVRKVGCAAENSIACIAIPFVRHPLFLRAHAIEDAIIDGSKGEEGRVCAHDINHPLW